MKMFGFNSIYESSMDPYFIFGTGGITTHKIMAKVMNEGDQIRILGILSFNRNADKWEFINPFSVLYLGTSPNNKVDYANFYQEICRKIDDYWWPKIK